MRKQFYWSKNFDICLKFNADCIKKSSCVQIRMQMFHRLIKPHRIKDNNDFFRSRINSYAIIYEMNKKLHLSGCTFFCVQKMSLKGTFGFFDTNLFAVAAHRMLFKPIQIELYQSIYHPEEKRRYLNCYRHIPDYHLIAVLENWMSLLGYRVRV